MFINNEEIQNYNIFDKNIDYFLIKDYKKKNYHKDNDRNIITKNKIDDSMNQDKKDSSLKTPKTKYRFKSFKIEKESKIRNSSSFSLDSIIISPNKNHIKTEIISPKLKKLKDNKTLENSTKLKNMTIPLINNINIKNNIKIPFYTFTNESLIKCHNSEIYFINDNNQNKKKINYYKKIIGDNTLIKNKSKKNNKIDYSIIKYLINIKDIISKIIKKNYYYKILGSLKSNALLNKMVNIFHNKKKDLMRNLLNKYRIKAQILKYLEQNKNKESIIRRNNMEIYKNKTLFIKNKVNNDNISNETNKTKKKLKNGRVDTKSNNNKKKYFIDKVIKFKIKKSCVGDIKFNKNKLLISKNTSTININKNNNENKMMIKPKNNDKEIKFNYKKLIMTKTSNIKINNQNNKNKIFIIDKIISKFNIRNNNNKQNKFIITKLINKSPIINISKKLLNNNFIITKTIKNMIFKGIIKNDNNNIIINKVINDYIIDDINKNKESKKKYYNSLIINNMNNLIINKIISHFNIKSQRNTNYIINKTINYKKLGNNSIQKNLYRFNEKKLIITKVKNNYMIKNKAFNKVKKQILNSTSLLKIKSIILKHVQKNIYPKIINLLKKYSFCNQIIKFNNHKMKLMKIIFINNLQSKKLEEKYKKFYLNNRFNSLIINKVIKYSIIEKNNFIGDGKTKINKFIEDNKKYSKYIIHKIKEFSMNNENNNYEDNAKKKINDYEENFLVKLIEKKNKNFVKGNVITKKINIFICNDGQNNKIKENKFKKENFPNSKGNKTKNDNKIYISSIKLNKSKNLKENCNNTNTYYNKKQQNILSSLGYNNKIYRKKKSIEKENDNIQKIKEIELSETQNEIKITLKKEYIKDKRDIKDKKELDTKEDIKKNNLDKDIEEHNNNPKKRYKKESESESEMEESEFEEEEENSENSEKAKEILIKYISKKGKILNIILLNTFNKWKRYNTINNNNNRVKRINNNEFNEHIFENGGINKSQKIFILYRKYSNYSYYIKKILKKWKKIVQDTKNKEKNKSKEFEDDDNDDEEEGEEIEDEEEETEEEME